jgi:hypothetical protein
MSLFSTLTASVLTSSDGILEPQKNNKAAYLQMKDSYCLTDTHFWHDASIETNGLGVDKGAG